jgi:hypothetical protein
MSTTIGNNSGVTIGKTKPGSGGGASGTLIREQFEFSGSQTFTLANNYGQVYSVEVQGQGALHTAQYTLVAPNQITIEDTLDPGDYLVIIYSTSEAGALPYYTQAEVDALINNIPEPSVKTLILDVSGDLLQAPAIGTFVPKSYTIPANTLLENSLVLIKMRLTRLAGSGNPFMSLRNGIGGPGWVQGVNGLYATRHIAMNDTSYRFFNTSGAFFDDMDSPTATTELVVEPIDRTVDTILDLELNFSTALTNEYKIEYVLIQSIK